MQVGAHWPAQRSNDAPIDETVSLTAFFCKVCRKSYPSSRSYKMHRCILGLGVKRKHSPLSTKTSVQAKHKLSFPDPSCGSGFGSTKDLAKHLRRSHSTLVLSPHTLSTLKVAR